MPKASFLKLLSQKLKVGNLRSIHLNAIPGRYATRLDIYMLSFIQKDLPLIFFNQLTTQPNFKLKISFENIDLVNSEPDRRNKLNFISKKLNSIHNQNIDDFLEHGVKSFAFGYPLLIKKDVKNPNKIIKAPLIIWYLDIERSMNHKNTWMIYRNEEFPINFNEILIHYLSDNENIKFNGLTDEVLEDGIIGTQEIRNICENLLSKFNNKFNNEFKNEFNLSTSKIPSTQEFYTYENSKPWIFWGGVFGLYRTQKESIIKDFEELISNYDKFEFDKLNPYPFQHTNISGVETDPSQQEIVDTLNKSKIKVIQGPPGTGKSQTITAIITNALENGAKCLVVCEKKTALDVIYKNLEKIDLNQFCTIIDNVTKDRKQIIDRVRYEIETKFSYYDFFRKAKYEENLKKFSALSKSYNERHKNFLKKIFGDYSLKDIISEYLKIQNCKNQKQIQDLIKSNFDLTYSEYRKHCELIENASTLYSKIQRFGNDKKIIKDKNFKDKYSNTFKLQFYEQLENIINSIKKLSAIYSSGYNKHFHHFTRYNFLYRFYVYFISLFSSDYKDIKNKWVYFAKVYDDIQEKIRNSDIIRFEFPKLGSTRNLDEIIKSIESFYEIEKYYINIKNYFKEYFAWNSYLINLSKEEKDLISLLYSTDDSSSDNWLIFFKKNYLYCVIETTNNKYGPFHDSLDDLKRIEYLYKKLQENQKYKIIKNWQFKRSKAVEKYNLSSNIKWLYNYRKNKKYSKKNSLRKIINEDINLFTTLFPVVLTNPVVCSSLFPLKEGLFDVVFFDEASQLRLEDTFPAFLRGKYRIISGDKHQMPPSNYFQVDISLDDDNEDEDDINTSNNRFLAESESLLEYVESLNPNEVNTSYLDFHYRSQHPDLINFSNAAFYGRRLVPIPSTNSYKPIRLIQVNGEYSDRKNIDEAKKIVEFIFDKINDLHTPSIGVATMNIEQRNLINDLFFEYSNTNRRYTYKYERLLENGFFVKNLENIQGDERDIIIVSTTFGYTSEGIFRQNFGPINREQGYRLLNVIVTRAKKYLYVFTSIPQKYYNNFESELKTKGNTGKAIFYAYLSYAESIENNDEQKKSDLLNILSNYGNGQLHSKISAGESLLSHEVYSRLSKHIDPIRIVKQYQFGGLIIDLVILHQESSKPLIAITFDGSAFHNTEQAYIYDSYLNKLLESYGIKFYRIWAINWWENPDRELDLLIEFIEEHSLNEGAANTSQHISKNAEHDLGLI